MQRMIVLGAKRSQGVLDNGTRYDNTKIYLKTRMRDGVDQVGFSVAEYNWGDSNNFYKIRDLKYPFEADIEMEIVSNGRTSQTVVVDVKPLGGK